MQRLINIEGLKENLRQESRLEDVAKHYGVELHGDGDTLKACCPFHEEDTPSFGISKSKQLYFCFGCKEGGDVFTFVQHYEQVPFDEVLRFMAKMVGYDLTPHLAELTETDKLHADYYDDNRAVMEACLNDARRDEWGAKRMLPLVVLDQYGVGYSEGPLSRSLHSKPLRLDWDTMWTNVITVPVRDAYGRVAGFRNRLLEPGKIKLLGPEKSHPLPVPEVYGLYEGRRAIRERGEVILVEGEPDVWQMVGHGFGNTASLLGSKLTDEMLAYMESIGIRRVIILADNDEAGRKFTDKVSRTRFKSKIAIKIARLMAEAKDPDEALLAEGPEAIHRSLATAKYAFEFLIDRIVADGDTESMTGKIDVLQDIQLQVTNATEFERSLAYPYLADRLHMDKEVVQDFFRDSKQTGEAALFDTRAEKIVLKQMMESLEFAGEALTSLKPTDFYLSRHRSIFEVAAKLYREQEALNDDTVRTTLGNINRPAITALDQIRRQASDTDSARYHLGDLRDKAIRREIQTRARQVALQMGDTTLDASNIIQSFSGEMAKAIAGNGEQAKDINNIVNSRIMQMHEQLKNPNAIIGLDLGPDWKTFNHALHGLQKGRYGILLAPAGFGKTAIGGSWMGRVSVELGEPTLYLTFETGPETLTDRLISKYSGVESDKIVTGFLTAEEVEHVHQAAAKIARSPMLITGRGSVVEEALAIIRNDVLRRGTKLVIVDYIQLMRSASMKSNVRRDQELGEISRQMFELAHDLGIHMVVLAQINRSGIKGGKPSKEDIGESYKIIQDCDYAYIAFEKSKEERDADGPDKGDAFGFIDKNRNGKTGVGANLIRDLDVMRIREAHPRF